MALNSTFAGLLLNFLFNNEGIPNYGDAFGIQPTGGTGGVMEIALIQSNGSEANYTGYQRVEVDRDKVTNEWSGSGNSISNVNEITFPTSTGGSSNTINKFRIYYGDEASQPFTTIFGEDSLTASVTITAGETPKFSAGALTLTFS